MEFRTMPFDLIVRINFIAMLVCAIFMFTIPFIPTIKQWSFTAPWWMLWFAPTLFTLIIIFIFGFSPIAYIITDNELIVKRRFMGAKKFPLRNFKTIEKTDGNFKWLTQRIVGNVGLFGYFGIFKNNQWGVFTAYATNADNSLVIKGIQTIVISPTEPDYFCEVFRAKLQLVYNKNR